MMKWKMAILAAVVLFVPTIAVRADQDTIKPFKAPELSSGLWINGGPVKLASERGKVVVLLFWTRTCINCKHNLGFWNDWAKKYNGTDVDVVSVHTPEIPSDDSVPGIRESVRQHGLAFPILRDANHATWDSYDVQAWPTEILIDKRGVVRYKFEGELNWQGSGEYKTVEGLIEGLRREK